VLQPQTNIAACENFAAAAKKGRLRKCRKGKLHTIRVCENVAEANCIQFMLAKLSQGQTVYNSCLRKCRKGKRHPVQACENVAEANCIRFGFAKMSQGRTKKDACETVARASEKVTCRSSACPAKSKIIVNTPLSHKKLQIRQHKIPLPNARNAQLNLPI
jgi:hypothetical protein